MTHIDDQANTAPCSFCSGVGQVLASVGHSKGWVHCRECNHSGIRNVDKIEVAIADSIFDAAGEKAAGNGGKVSREDFRTIVGESLDTVMGSRGHDGVVFYAP